MLTAPHARCRGSLDRGPADAREEETEGGSAMGGDPPERGHDVESEFRRRRTRLHGQVASPVLGSSIAGYSGRRTKLRAKKRGARA